MRQGLFQHHDARQLWLASALLSAAMWMLQISIALYVLSVAGTAELAAVQLAGVLPALLIMPVAGLAADRFPVRPLLLCAVGVQTIAVIGIAMCVRAQDLMLLAALFALHGTAMAFWPPARQQWLYGLIDAELRQRANAAFGSLNGIMTIVGAVAAGVVSVWSPVASIGGAAVLTAIGAVLLLRVRPPVRVADRPLSGTRIGDHLRAFGTGLRDGFGAARRFPLARSVIWIGIAWGFIGGGYTVMVNGRIVEDLGGSPLAVAAVFTFDGLAVLAGTLCAGRLRRTAHLPVWAVCYVVQGLVWAAFFLASDLAGAIACIVIMRLAGGFIIALDTTILLQTVPAEFRGRVTSVHLTTYNAVARLSLAALGAALALVPLAWLGVGAGLLSALFGVMWWMASGRRARSVYLASYRRPGAYSNS